VCAPSPPPRTLTALAPRHRAPHPRLSLTRSTMLTPLNLWPRVPIGVDELRRAPCTQRHRRRGHLHGALQRLPQVRPQLDEAHCLLATKYLQTLEQIIWANYLEKIICKYLHYICKYLGKYLPNICKLFGNLCVWVKTGRGAVIHPPNSCTSTSFYNHPLVQPVLIATPPPPTPPCLCSVQWDPARLYQLQMATLHAPRIPGFSSRYPEVDGCCMGNRKKCKCGAPFFS